jgi:tetraacyldisaccharide 4'-kinase
VAVLSRGYKRKSRGFMIATKDTPMRQIGDEPFQMKQKFPTVTIAVDAKRCHGIDRLTTDDPALDVVLLDDAFQHRYVKPGINILLVDYHRLVIYDCLLPAGRLREPLKGKDRADIVIVTKCPKELKPMEYRVITKAMNLFPYQRLYFTTLRYDRLHPLFLEKAADGLPTDIHRLADLQVMLLTGIASPEQLTHDLKPLCAGLTPLSFGDHHQFSRKDVALINDTFSQLPQPRCIITTEKDSTRLLNIEELSDDVRSHLCVLPVRIAFMLEQEDTFNQQITSYVFKNSKDSILLKGKKNSKPSQENSAKEGQDKPARISFRDSK